MATCEEVLERSPAVMVQSRRPPVPAPAVPMEEEYDQLEIDVLLASELKYLPKGDFLKCGELSEHHRSVAVDWLMEVAERYGMLTETVWLAVNFMDRFLGLSPLSVVQVPLLASACLWIASKLREPIPISVYEISDLNRLKVDSLKQMETLVLNKLSWEINAVSPHILYGLFITGLNLDVSLEMRAVIGKHAEFFVDMAFHEYKYATLRPSVVAACSVMCALHNVHRLNDGVLHRLVEITGTSSDFLKEWFQQLLASFHALCPQEAKADGSKAVRVETISPATVRDPAAKYQFAPISTDE